MGGELLSYGHGGQVYTLYLFFIQLFQTCHPKPSYSTSNKVIRKIIPCEGSAQYDLLNRQAAKDAKG